MNAVVASRPRRHRAASRDLLGKNNNGCTEPRVRTEAANRSGAGPRPARPSQSAAARLLPGGRPVLQHHDVRGDGPVRHHLLSPPRSRQPAGHDAAHRRDDLGVSGGAVDAAGRPQHRLSRRLAVRHDRRHRDVPRPLHRQLPGDVPRRPDSRLCGVLPADVPLCRGGAGAAPLPRQGDFLGDGRRRRRRGDRPQPRARDARSGDAAVSGDLCHDFHSAHHRFHDHVLHHLPFGRDLERGRRPCRSIGAAAAAAGRSPASRASSRPSWPACWRSARCPSS